MATLINQKTSSLGTLILKHKDEILREWIAEMAESARRGDLMKEGELRTQCSRFLDLLTEATGVAGVNVQASAYDGLRDMLADISRSRALQGFSPKETAKFVFSIKKSLFKVIRDEFEKDPRALATETWNATELLDSLGLYTTDIYLKSREEIVRRQQEELLELSTPVVKLWEGILALPLIGTLDSART
ncbi:MAG TPA: RsbRD N-terminal domain-containing protein, partial [Terriglobales bacterium]|nr:RsbRD N-terminal domain-containing protein [Terriglobales bacterium]